MFSGWIHSSNENVDYHEEPNVPLQLTRIEDNYNGSIVNKQQVETYIALEEGLLLRRGTSTALSFNLDIFKIGRTGTHGFERNPLNGNAVTEFNSRLKIYSILDLQKEKKS